MGLYDRMKDTLIRSALYSPVGAAMLPLINKLEEKKRQIELAELERQTEENKH